MFELPAKFNMSPNTMSKERVGIFYVSKFYLLHKHSQTQMI